MTEKEYHGFVTPLVKYVHKNYGVPIGDLTRIAYDAYEAGEKAGHLSAEQTLVEIQAGKIFARETYYRGYMNGYNEAIEEAKKLLGVDV